MKKIFTLLTAVLCSLTITATDYKGKLMVVLNNTPLPSQDAVISVTEDNGKYTLSLKNFILIQPEGPMPIGNIVVTDIKATQENGETELDTRQDIVIAPGDDENITTWYGPILSSTENPIPVVVDAAMMEDFLNAEIGISFGDMRITVYFDSRQFQLPNSGFEDFHKASAGSAESDEPNNWHSFMSCTGSYASIVNTVPHTFISDDVRPESDGNKSVLIKSGLVLGSIVANGTLTTGQLMAGAISATDTGNNAFIDLTNEEKDANGDPFYARLYSQPDSISMWVKFKQGGDVPDHPYATMTAVITDGSYYQEPADKDYSSIIVARAANNTIKNTGEWQRITVPFDYDSYSGDNPQTILVTLSTNADPGKGTGNDELYVDDIELVYNSQLSEITIADVAIPGFDKNKYKYEYIFEPGRMPTPAELADIIDFEENGEEAMSEMQFDAVTNTASILVVAGDLSGTHTYTVKFKEGSTGIENVANGNNTDKVVYNLQGQIVKTMKKGEVYIIKYANGKTVKSIK